MESKLKSIGVLETYIENGVLLFRRFDFTLSDVEEAVTNERYEDMLIRRERQYSIYQRFKEITTNKEGYGYGYIIFQLHNLFAPYFGYDVLKEVKEERAKFDANSFVSLQQVFNSKIDFLDDILDDLEEREALAKERKALTTEQPAPVPTSTVPKKPSNKQKIALDELAKQLSNSNVAVLGAIMKAANKANYTKDNVWKLYGKVKNGELIHKELAVIIDSKNKLD